MLAALGAAYCRRSERRTALRRRRALPRSATRQQRSAALFTELGKVLDPSALRELPSGRRPPAPRRLGRLAPAAGRARCGRPWASRPCAARSATKRPISTRPACRATRSGISRRVKWRGKARRSLRFCAQIKDPARNGGRSVEDLIHHIGDDTLVGWAWAPGFGRQPAPGTQKQAGALVDAWVKNRRSLPELTQSVIPAKAGIQ